MSKKILILETSVTLQKLFTTTLDSDDYQVQFINDGKAAIYTLFEYQPDLFLVNCDIREPRSFEVVRIVRSLPSFKDLTIGMYASFPTPLDEAFALSSGATSFVRLDQKTLVLNVDELAQLPSHKIDRVALSQIKKNFDDTYLFMNTTELLFNDSYKNAMFAKLVSMVDTLENIEESVKAFLFLIAEVCEVPIVGLYMIENDGPHGYYVCSENIGEKEITDFLSVCAADFEKVQPDFNATKITPLKLETKAELNRFYSGKVQLSSYEYGTLIGTTTYGKGVVQGIRRLLDQSAVKLTTSKYFTPKGENIHGTGIAPDIELEYKYTGSDADLNMIEQLAGMPVIRIQDNAVNSNTVIVTLDCGSILEEIGANAFSGCTSLSAVDLPSTLVTIGGAAFANTFALNAIDLDDVCLRKVREKILRVSRKVRQKLSDFAMDQCSSYPYFVTKTNYFYALRDELFNDDLSPKG